MSAPTAGNERPWPFMIVRERQKLDAITQFQLHAQMIKEASLAILVCGDESLEKYRGFWPQDRYAPRENMLLAPCSSDLGPVWLGIYLLPDRVASMRQFMGLPGLGYLSL